MKGKTGMANQAGALLISLIVTMVVITVLGSGMLYLTTTSSYGELFANRQARAYYLGEAGANYAFKRFIANPVANGPFAAPTTFTLSNGDQFAVKTYDQPADPTHLIIESTGIVSSGWLTARNKVTKNIIKAAAALPGQDVPVPVGFDTNTDTTLDTTWNVAPGTDASIVSTGPSDGPALQLKGDVSTVSLNWQGSSAAPDLVAVWNSNGQLLSYTIQVKINIDQEGSKGRHYLAGLSFRLDNTTDDSYGVSYFRSYGTDAANKKPAWIKSAAFADFLARGINNGNLYAVFWKKIAGTYTVLDYRLLTTGDGVISGGNLLPWSSLIVKVDEQFSGPDGARQNHIYAYLAGENSYPRGTVSWTLTGFNEILWSQYAGIPAWMGSSAYAAGSVVVPDSQKGHSYVCVTAGTSGSSAPSWPTTRDATVADGTAVWAESNKLIDGSLTSANFDTRRPDEIGVHAFYDSNAANDQFFTDFGMVLKGSGSGSGGVQY
ncbi:MAG: type IV pilus modification PilV family protein [Syntrophales bacterium]